MNKKLIGRILAILFAVLLALSPLASVVAQASPIQGQSVDSDSTFWDRLMGRTELTEYEKEQQELPLSQRDRIIAEPGLLAFAMAILVWFVWKIRRDIKKIKKDNEEYDRLRKETEANLAAFKDDEDELEDALDDELDDEWDDEDDLLDEADEADEDADKE